MHVQRHTHLGVQTTHVHFLVFGNHLRNNSLVHKIVLIVDLCVQLLQKLLHAFPDNIKGQAT